MVDDDSSKSLERTDGSEPAADRVPGGFAKCEVDDGDGLIRGKDEEKRKVKGKKVGEEEEKEWVGRDGEQTSHTVTMRYRSISDEKKS